MPIENPWTQLRELTAARIALGRAGHSLPTRELLAFQLAHAKARDAVWLGLDATSLISTILSTMPAAMHPLHLHSAARDRAEYLRRPDLGRTLSAESAERILLETRTTLKPAVRSDETRTTLKPAVRSDETRTTLKPAVRSDETRTTLKPAVRSEPGEWDAVIVIADGLSALAVHRYAGVLLDALLPLLLAPGNRASTRVSTLHANVRAPRDSDSEGWRIAPVCVVEQGRVAIGDDVGERTGAAMALVILGERPGLSSPDSLGAYLTWSPRVGRTDAERNCVSNIRAGGLEPEIAAVRIAQLMRAGRQQRLTGVGLSIGQVLA